MQQPRLIVINLNYLSSQTILGIAKDFASTISDEAFIKDHPPSYSYELKSIFHVLREQLDKDKGKEWVDKNLPISDWSVI